MHMMLIIRGGGGPDSEAFRFRLVEKVGLEIIRRQISGFCAGVRDENEYIANHKVTLRTGCLWFGM